MLVRAVLFDLDGVLVDSLPLRLTGLRRVISMFSDSVPDDGVLLRLLCFGPKRALLEAVGSGSPAYRAFEQFCRTNVQELLAEFPGIEPMLRKLRDMGIRIGVVTSRNRQDTERWLHQGGLAVEFDVIVTYSEVRCAKPNPAGLIRALELLGVDRKDCLYVGDTCDDIEAGRRAGVASALAAWGSPIPSFVTTTTPPDVVFTHPEHLLTWIGQGEGKLR
jgi:HAD superfamily hydrolase (TIGR01549 family)